MKKIVLCLIFTSLLISQEVTKLKKDSSRIVNQIKIKTDSLQIIATRIKELKHQSYISDLKNRNVNEISTNGICDEDCNIKNGSYTFSGNLASVAKGDTVKLIGYEKSGGYWYVEKDNHKGYLLDRYIQETDETNMFKQWLLKKQGLIEAEKVSAAQKQLEQEIMQEDNVIQETQKAYRKKLVAKYGKHNADKILNNYYWIGMTAEMAIISLGKPNSINKSVGKWGVHEQWVYDGEYLYFENGKLTSFQNSR